MKISFLFCFLSLFLAASCGSDNDDNDDGGVSINTPTNEDNDRQNEEDDTVVSKYTAIKLNANGFYEPSYEHTLRADLGRRPLILTGNFVEYSMEEGNEGSPAATCTFTVTLSDTQANKLERLANKLKVCSSNRNGEEVVDFEENDLMYLTDRSGKETEAFKSNPGDFDMDYSWICGGGSSFYRYVKSLVAPKVPETCPAGSLSKF